MPVIAFANPKGGAGKTTSALLLASELASRGATVSIGIVKLTGVFLNRTKPYDKSQTIRGL
jgi:Mrp family chromosome partitioning ATPase